MPVMTETLSGWAIPAATDVTFALGVLALLGSRVPVSLKISCRRWLFWMTWGRWLSSRSSLLQHFTSDAGWCSGNGCSAVSLNRAGVTRLLPYLLTGEYCGFMLQSGVHATVAGILLAFFIPLRTGNAADEVPLDRLEHAINPGSRL